MVDISRLMALFFKNGLLHEPSFILVHTRKLALQRRSLAQSLKMGPVFSLAWVQYVVLKGETFQGVGKCLLQENLNRPSFWRKVSSACL